MSPPDLPKVWHPRPPAHTTRFRSWLLESGSLTRRIQSACSDFGVQLVSQSMQRPFWDESDQLGLPARCQAWVREVFLRCGSRNVVFAHSVVPLPGLASQWRHLRSLGIRPLGAALFVNPQIDRSSMAYRKLLPRHALYQAAVARSPTRPSALWARRSMFTLHGHSILVTEVFLPAILDL